MVENFGRKIILIAVLVLMALVMVQHRGIKYGLDLRGGTRLAYQVDFDAARERGDIERDDNPLEVLQEMVTIIRQRIDPQGVLDATIQTQGEDRILVELPLADDATTDAVIARISQLGQLEQRMVATDDYNKAGVRFDLDEERRRLREWLEQPENREAVRRDPLAIFRFNRAAGTEEGPLSQYLWWYPDFAEREVRTVTEGDPPVEVTREVWVPRGRTPGASHPEPTTAEDPSFVPINMHEVHFTGADLVAGSIRQSISPEGQPAVDYQIVPARAGTYADLSGANIGKAKAIILNNMVRSAPVFRGRIPGRGQITLSGADPDEVSELVLVLKTGSLKVKPEMLSRTTMGPGLGQQAIQRGALSLMLGGGIIVLFMLAYYRMAGIVAITSLLVNLVLLVGAMAAIQATLTLPGIAGLVLTVGMAVDANILIYERIREERDRGKGLAQAARAGFDRAFVAILDSNITTFLVGLILYNVGTGPVRGFAVTLMIGIATTLFSGVFYSRVILHLLIHYVKLDRLAMARLLTQINVPWMSYRKVFMGASAVVLVTGLAVFFACPPYVKFGTDFLGGAVLRMSLREPMTQGGVMAALLQDEGFREEFPVPSVTTADDLDEQGRARQFVIKLKLTPEQRERIAAEEAEARRRDEAYVPPFRGELARVLRDQLSHDAFEELRLEVLEGVTMVEASVHFASPVRKAALMEALARFSRPEVEVRDGRPAGAGGDGDVAPEEGTHFFIEVEMPPTVTTPDMAVAEFQEALRDLKDVEDRTVALSTPFPEAEIIGPRAAGDLVDAAGRALLLALGAIILFLRFRFHEFKYGFAAVAAVVHDVLVVLGIVVAFHWWGPVHVEIDLALIAVFLAIIGYSVNDTIVVFDRVRENLAINRKLGNTKESFADVLNRSINQTFARTVWTTSTTLAVVACQFFLNVGTGSPLEGFAFPMMLGLIAGAYSTIFIACPVVLWIEQRWGGARAGSRERAAQPVPTRPVGPEGAPATP